MNCIYFSETYFDKNLSVAKVKAKQSEYCKSIVLDAICQECRLKLEKTAFLTDACGKPYLEGNLGFHFNISHTKSAIAAAISNKPVGIDIELIKKVNMKLAGKIFTKPEIDYITGLPSETDKRFYEIWTRKEAYAKCLGTGIFTRIPLNTFDTLAPESGKHISSIFIDRYVVSVCGDYALNEFNFRVAGV